MGRDHVTTLDADPAIAKTEFTKVFKENKKTTIMIILGNTDTIFKSMNKANARARDKYGNPGFERWVIWIKDHDLLKEHVQPLLLNSADPKASRPFEIIKCFCLSPKTHQAAGVILHKGKLNSTRFTAAFVKAEKIDA